MPLNIHGSPLSPFTRKVTIVALEMGLDFESHDLNPYTSAEKLAALNPLKRIPVIEHDGFILADSSAICSYFQSRFSNSLSLLPDKPEDLGKALWIEEYADTALFDVISKGVFKPIFVNPLMGKAQDFDTVRDTLVSKLPEPLAYLNAQLDGRTWYAGDRMSIADIAIYAQLANLEHAQQLPKPEDYPALMTHYRRLQSGPSEAKLFKSEQAYLEQALKQLDL